MYRNFVMFSRLCECHQSLVRILSASFSSLPKLNSCVSQQLLSSTSSCSPRAYHAAFSTTVHYLTTSSSKKSISGNNNHSYCQPRRQNSCLFRKSSSSFVINGTPRRYSSTTAELEGLTPIHLWGHETEPFGTLNIDVPFHVLVKPLDYEKYPEMNRAFVKLLVPSTEEEDESQENSKRSRWLNLYNMETSLVDDQLTLTGKLPKDILVDHLPPITCLVEIPIKFNVNVNVDGKANVSLSNMENDNIFIRCQNGNCHLKNIKTGKIDVYCETGSLECSGVLQGNIRVGCGGEGTIKAKRLQGQNIMCRTVSGNIDISDIYAEETMITASKETVLNLGSCHGKTLVNINSGNINIKSVEGNLEAITQAGDVDVALTNTKKKAYVCSKNGDVVIGLPKPADMDLDLLAAGIKLTKDFTYLLKSVSETTDHTELLLMALEETIGKRGYSTVTGDAKMGILTVKYQDWLSSMGLQFKE